MQKALSFFININVRSSSTFAALWVLFCGKKNRTEAFFLKSQFHALVGGWNGGRHFFCPCSLSILLACLNVLLCPTAALLAYVERANSARCMGNKCQTQYTRGMRDGLSSSSSSLVPGWLLSNWNIGGYSGKEESEPVWHKSTCRSWNWFLKEYIGRKRKAPRNIVVLNSKVGRWIQVKTSNLPTYLESRPLMTSLI